MNEGLSLTTFDFDFIFSDFFDFEFVRYPFAEDEEEYALVEEVLSILIKRINIY
jgi:hypothetical protein